MSLHDRFKNRVSLPLRIAAVCAAAGFLGGCFQPMYGGVGGGQLVSELQAIKVEPIPDRLGHYLGNELIFNLNGTGSSPTPKYRLVVTARERVSSPLVDTVTARATAGTVLVDAEYKLYREPFTEGDKPIVEDVAVAAEGYDRSSQRFANLRAARYAEIQNAKVLADQIRTRLAISLAKPS
jgi:LPS-assembly lipoprotein